MNDDINDTGNNNGFLQECINQRLMLIEFTYPEKEEVEADKWYEYSPDTVTENENETCTIPWDMPAHTDKDIKPNRSDFIIKDQELKKCVLIDMAIPAKRNTSFKVIEKLSKCYRV